MSGPGNQGTLLSNVTFPEMVNLVRNQWTALPNYLERNAMQMYVIDPIGTMNGNSRRYNEYDTETFADVKPEGAAAQKTKFGVGYYKDLTVKTIAKQADITVEDRMQNRYPEVKSKLTSMMDFCANRIDLDLSHRFTFATSSSYTDMNGNTVDTTMGAGNPPALNAHTLAFSATTYSTRVSGDPSFSETSLEAALLLAKYQVFTNFGGPRQMNFNVIFCTRDPQTNREIDQLIQSTADVTAVQAGIVNVYKGQFRKVVLPYLDTDANGAPDSTKRRWWGVAAIGQGIIGLNAMFAEVLPPQLRSPSEGSNGENIDTLNWTWTTFAMYGSTIVSAKGCVMSCPNS